MDFPAPAFFCPKAPYLLALPSPVWSLCIGWLRSQHTLSKRWLAFGPSWEEPQRSCCFPGRYMRSSINSMPNKRGCNELWVLFMVSFATFKLNAWDIHRWHKFHLIVSEFAVGVFFFLAASYIICSWQTLQEVGWGNGPCGIPLQQMHAVCPPVRKATVFQGWFPQ